MKKVPGEQAHLLFSKNSYQQALTAIWMELPQPDSFSVSTTVTDENSATRQAGTILRFPCPELNQGELLPKHPNEQELTMKVFPFSRKREYSLWQRVTEA